MMAMGRSLAKIFSGRKALLAAGAAVALASGAVSSAAASDMPAGDRITPAQFELDEQLTCLAQNIYFEARSEPVDGMLAVAHVVLNRVSDPRFPDTICGVVRQGGEQVRHRCQFSWWCDGRSDTPHNKVAWDVARLLAWFVYHGHTADPTGGALWYHADYAKPYWREAFVPGPQIGRHIFYRTSSS